MAEDDGTLGGAELRELLQLISGTDIENLEIEVGGTRLYLERGMAEFAAGTRPAQDSPRPIPEGMPASFVVSDRVGFFHYSDGELITHPKVGDQVAADQVLGVIDSVSVLTPVQAACSGRLDEVLVDEGQPVEFGQPLFVIRPE